MESIAAASSSILIRPATRVDAAGISELVSHLAKKYIAHEFTEEGRRRLLDAMTPAAIQQLFELGYRYFVAEAGGTLAGVVATRDDRHLYHLFVAKQFHRQGLARRLWQVARDACIESAGTREFTVNASRYAVPAYERLGFVVAGAEQTTNGVISIPMKLSVATTRDS